jgi:hypothetical protein
VLLTHLSRFPPPCEFQPIGIHYRVRVLLDTCGLANYNINPRPKSHAVVVFEEQKERGSGTR